MSGDWVVYKHVRKRLWQRYRVRITLNGYRALCRTIANGRHHSELVAGHDDEGRVLIEFRFHRRPILAVWDNEMDAIITALPFSARRKAKVAYGTLT